MKSRLCVGALATLFFGNAAATRIIVDQTVAIKDPLQSAVIDTNQFLAQTFTAGVTGGLVSLNLVLYNGSSAFGGIDIEVSRFSPIQDPNPDQCPVGCIAIGDLLASASLDSSAVPDFPDNDTWTSVDFTDAPFIEEGLQYAIVLSTPTTSGVNWRNTNPTDEYALGQAYVANNTAQWDGIASNTWVSMNSADFNFETVVDTSIVPIPAAAWLFGSGLIGLVGMARRKAA